MCGTGKIHVVRTRTVASQAALRDFFGSSHLEVKYLAFVAAAVYMLRAWTVTSLATASLGSVFSFQNVVPVAGFLKIVEDLLVAGLASIGAYVWRRGGLRWLFGNIVGCDLRAGGRGDEERRKYCYR